MDGQALYKLINVLNERVNNISAELKESQQECHGYSGQLVMLRNQNEHKEREYVILKQEIKNLKELNIRLQEENAIKRVSLRELRKRLRKERISAHRKEKNRRKKLRNKGVQVNDKNSERLDAGAQDEVIDEFDGQQNSVTLEELPSRKETNINLASSKLAAEVLTNQADHTENQEDSESAATGRGSQCNKQTTVNYCHICTRQYCNKYYYRNHMKSMHGIDLGDNYGDEFVCLICQRGFHAKKYLLMHKTKMHCPTRGVSAYKKASKNKKKNKKLTSRLEPKCDHCGKVFSNRQCLKTHQVTFHSGNEPWKCEICGENFVRIDYLQRHLNKSHPSSEILSRQV